ncbi:MAG: hypothetical protein Q8Q29_10500 [Actinomycetota bacterium]|nr:hypothetical protein [Actinomycetota bacterium]
MTASATGRRMGHSVAAVLVFALSLVGVALPLIVGGMPEAAWPIPVAFGLLGP